MNRFLQIVLRWQQLGRSNNDIWCEPLRKKVGIDSVFSYKRNPNANQQIIVVEAKTSKVMSNINRSKIEQWVSDLLPKIENAPYSPDFHDKFNPETDSQYQMGLIALWIRDHASYSLSELQNWLSQVHVPQRRLAINICLIGNETILNFCAIHSRIETVRHSGQVQYANSFFPSYGDQSPADGSCIPLEALLSRFHFFKARKTPSIRGNNGSLEHDVNIVFYTGEIANYTDFRFIGLALKHFQLLSNVEVELYTLYDPDTIRNYYENFLTDFKDMNTAITLRKLDVASDLPGWLDEHD